LLSASLESESRLSTELLVTKTSDKLVLIFWTYRSSKRKQRRASQEKGAKYADDTETCK